MGGPKRPRPREDRCGAQRRRSGPALGQGVARAVRFSGRRPARLLSDSPASWCGTNRHLRTKTTWWRIAPCHEVARRSTKLLPSPANYGNRGRASRKSDDRITWTSTVKRYGSLIMPLVRVASNDASSGPGSVCIFNRVQMPPAQTYAAPSKSRTGTRHASGCLLLAGRSRGTNNWALDHAPRLGPMRRASKSHTLAKVHVSDRRRS